MLVDTRYHMKVMNTRKFEAVLGADSTALIKAVAKGKVKLTKILVEGGAHVDTQDGNGRSALIVACMLKPTPRHKDVQLKLVKVLLEHGANVNEIDKYGRTAIMYAISGNASLDVLRELLASDADPRAVDRSGTSALVYAVNSGRTDALYLLIEACRLRGKEVIIITDKDCDGNGRREVRQYLDIPQVDTRSPSIFEYSGPLKFDYQLPKVIDRPERGLTSPLIEADSTDRPAEGEPSPASDFTHPILTIQTPEGGHSDQPVLRIQTPNSIPGVLTDVEEDSPDGVTNVSPVTMPTRKHSRRRRKLQRRQSSDNFYLEPNHPGSNEGSESSLCSPNHSLTSLRNRSMNNSPEPRPPLGSPGQPGGGRPRRRCLPGMPPPLKKSQTVHAIRVSPHLLNNYQSSPMRAGSDDKIRQDQGDESWDSSSSLGDVKPSGSCERISLRRAQLSNSHLDKMLLRRDSAPMLLDDELSKRRPGVLPALNRNYDQPLPDIGSSFESLSDKRIFSRLDRRSSIQLEDIGRLRRQSYSTKGGSASQNDLGLDFRDSGVSDQCD